VEGSGSRAVQFVLINERGIMEKSLCEKCDMAYRCDRKKKNEQPVKQCSFFGRKDVTK
jgi:hypothetical protein